MEFSKRNLIIVGGIIIVLLLGILLIGKKGKKQETSITNSKDFETEEIGEEIVERDEVEEVIPTINPNTGGIVVSITPIPTKTIVPTLTPTLRPTLIPTERPDIDPEDTINWDEDEIEPTPTKKSTPTPDKRIWSTGVSLSATESRLYPGERQKVTAKVEPDNTTDKTVFWSSNNKSVATVTSKGLIKAIKTGTATVTAKTINGKTTNVNVVVMESINPTNTPTPTLTPTLTPTPKVIVNPESISLNDEQINLDKNQKKQVTVTFNPSNTTQRNIRWSSSDSSVASVLSGLITAKKAGTVTIRATTENNKTDTLTVTVKETVTPIPTKTPTPTPTTGVISPIQPPSGADLVFNETSNTLKVTIEEVNTGEYYVARMWVKDAYNQFKKSVKPSDWGTSNVLKFVHNRMNNEITSKNLKDKIVVAINASAFWGDREATTGYYSLNKPTSVAMNNVYKKSPDGTIVINDGVIARNRPQDFAWLGESIFAINRNGNLKSYSISGNTLEKRQQQHQTIIDDGVKNTFAFNITLVSNGQSRLADGTCVWCRDQRARQVWCQVDKNNFMFITYVKEGGKSLIEVAQLAQNLGCKTAVNLDGGGSAQIAYKKAGQSTFNYRRASRPVGDALYVTE